jgi:hypothetical protein
MEVINFYFFKIEITIASGANSHDIHQNCRHQIIIHHIK